MTKGQKVADWAKIGTVVGSASTGSYTFILKSMQAKLGDIVATRVEVPTASDASKHLATVWGRVISIDRFNPFFPAEAAQELANQSIDLIDTVLSGSRDHLEAQVLILGTTFEADGQAELTPLTYPVKPSAPVLYPDAVAVRQLLTGEQKGAEQTTSNPKLRIGSLIGRADVDVSLSAKQVVSRHLAILAMTGGGKTVAARRIIRELIDLKYPLVIFDPHGDYLGLFEKRHLFDGSDVKILYPVVRVSEKNISIISDLITKMGRSLTDPQQQFFNFLINGVDAVDGEEATKFIQRLIDYADNIAGKKKNKDHVSDELTEVRGPTINAVKRSLSFVLNNLDQMERNNKRLREQPRFAAYQFDEMPDPMDVPEDIVRPGQVSIFYLAGYDHLNQSAIVSIVLEALFSHRLTLSDKIPPFQAVVEEAHNFIPSRREGVDETPSLPTIRKVITEGRKFGTGLVLISQRPSRLDETTLAQCNSFLVLRLVNPNDKRFVRSVMENLSEADANILQTFGPGQGIVSGQAVRFPLLVKVDFDDALVSDAIGDEDFIAEAARWKPNEKREAASRAVRDISPRPKPEQSIGAKPTPSKPGRRSKRIRPEGF